MFSVVDNGSTYTSSRVNASVFNRDGGQMNQEHSKSNRERSQNLQNTTMSWYTNLISSTIKSKAQNEKSTVSTHRDMGVSGISLGNSSREDCVDKNRSANNLISLGVIMAHNIGTSTLNLKKDGWNPLTTPTPQSIPRHCITM